MVQSLATPQRRNMAQPDTYAVAINIFWHVSCYFNVQWDTFSKCHKLQPSQ